MKKTIIIGLMILMVLPIVSATPSFYVQQNKDYNLKIGCFNSDNSFCLNSTNCTITITNQNGTTITNNQNMTYNIAFYNYTIDNTILNIQGEYQTITQCIGPTNGFQTFTFEVTKDGFPNEQNTGLYLSLTALFIFFITIGLIFYFWRGEKKHD